MLDFATWSSFFIIVGSSAGALIGLEFVVMTLITERSTQSVAEASSAFGTPTIVHFGTALLLSAVLSAPWQGTTTAAEILTVMGLVGVVYMIMIARRMRAQREYRPAKADWIYYALVPSLAYAILALSGFAALSNIGEALFGVAGAALLLLFIGIHNAWDTIVYLVFYSDKKNTNSKR